MYDEFISKHYRENFFPLVKKYSQRAGSIQDAEDVIQTAYLRALVYQKSYNKTKNFDSWLNTIIFNALRDYKNSEKGVKVDLNEEELEMIEDENIPNQITDEVRSVIAKKDNPNVKEVLELYYLYGYKTKSITKVTKLPYSHVRYILKVFQAEIKERYDEEGSR